MSYSNSAAAYREREVLSASPARLVVLVFENALMHLMRARVGHEKGDVALRLESVAKARDAIMELVATLDDERGGEIARNLRALYAFILTELLEAGARFDAPRVSRTVAIVTDLRDAFATIDAESARVSAA